MFYLTNYNYYFCAFNNTIIKFMERVYILSERRIKNTSLNFVRYLNNKIDWNDRLIGLTGFRGCGKTTLMLQQLKIGRYPANTAVYVSLDEIWFTQNRLVDFADDFVNKGGKYLFLDEVHKYPSWSIEIKNLNDSYADLHIVFSGSSMLEVYKGGGDLSRRLSLYHLYPLSFREFLEFEHHIKIEKVSFTDIISNHKDISFEITQKVKPIAHIKDFLTYGSLPFFKENKTKYHDRLREVVNLILETDLPAITDIDYAHVLKLKKLLMVIAGNVPFRPNITQLAAKIETERRTLYKYLDILERAGLIIQLSEPGNGLNVLTKADKLLLGSPNLCHALCSETPNIGNLRETFFVNQLQCVAKVNSSQSADFLIDTKYTIEVGGRNKDSSQINNIENAYLAIDDIENGYGKRIPLWLFGMMY